MLDHITLGVTDIEASKAFYDPVLQTLGIVRLYAEGDDYAGYGIGKKAFFWIGWSRTPVTGVHVAFTAASRDAVSRFHAAALAHGGRNNGDPGLRPRYHAHYYGAFVLDPDGHNVEAVCHDPV